MSTSVSRIRRKTTAVSSSTFKLGRFSSAVYNRAGTFLFWNPPTPWVTGAPAASYSYGQVVYDEIHRGPLRERAGGPFTSLRYDLGYDPSQAIGSGVYHELNAGPASRVIGKYEGGFMPPANTFFGQGAEFSNLAPLLSDSNAVLPNMGGLGSRAWLATKPRLEQSSAFQDVFESDEIPGQFTGTREFVHSMRETAQDWKNKYISEVGTHVRGSGRLVDRISQEWLNANFGWLPFLRSVYDLSKIMGNFSNFVKKFTKLNGRPFRKKVNLVNDDPSEVVLSRTQLAPNSISYAIPVFPQSFPAKYFAAAPHYELIESVRTRQWGVGKWTYYRPEFDATLPGYDSAWSSVRRAMTIAGLRITPTSLYNVIPWSWLLSWVTNVGDYVNELTDIWEDQIVNHYCFVMQAVERQRRFVVHLPFYSGGLNLTFTRVIASKQRSKASSPFGFDLDVSDLSLRQLSILAALKTSRRRR